MNGHTAYCRHGIGAAELALSRLARMTRETRRIGWWPRSQCHFPTLGVPWFLAVGGPGTAQTPPARNYSPQTPMSPGMHLNSGQVADALIKRRSHLRLRAIQAPGDYPVTCPQPSFGPLGNSGRPRPGGRWDSRWATIRLDVRTLGRGNRCSPQNTIRFCGSICLYLAG